MKQVKYIPYITYALVTLNVLVFGVMQWRFGTTESSHALMTMGANFGPAVIVMNQWWRLITAGFIHIGIMHLVMNMFVLYYLGEELEQIIGHTRFLIVYLTAVLGGNLMTAMMSTSIAAGASTGIFGMFFAMVILGWLFPQNGYLRSRGMTFGLLIVMNVVFDLLSSRVDNFGHIGGAIYGALMTLVLFGSAKKSPHSYRSLALFAMVVLTGALLWIGFNKIGG